MKLYEVRHQERPRHRWRTRLVTEFHQRALARIGELGHCFLVTWEDGSVVGIEEFGVIIAETTSS